MVIRPFLSPGSKGRLARRLIEMMSPHDTYVEPHAGGAACYWRKPPVDREVLNDLDPDVATTYTVLRDLSDQGLAEFAALDWVVSRAQFAASQRPPASDRQRAQHFLYRRRATFGSFERSLLRVKVGTRLPVTAANLEAWRRRLADTTVRNGDALDVIREYDRPGVFVFVDPPWPKFFKKWDHWTVGSFRQLIETLDGVVHARWMFAENPEIDQLVAIPDGWHRTRVGSRSAGYDGVVKTRHELVLTNYPAG